MSETSQYSSMPCLCIRMRRAAQKVTDFYDQMLSSTGLTVNQFSLLVNISRMEGCGTGELARKVGQEKSTLVRTLQPLIRNGLVKDRSSEGERRRRLYLTPQGTATLTKAVPLWKKAQTALAEKLGTTHTALLEIFDGIDILE